jgi:uncharacterized membrane protein YhaH (DUF805 family)
MNQGPKPSVLRSLPTYADPDSRDLKWLLFSVEGRASRAEYWKGSLFLFLGAMTVCFLAGFAFALGAPSDAASLATLDASSLAVGERALLIGGAALVLCVPLLWASVALGVKRWHDRDKSGAWMFIQLVPYVGFLWALVECGFLRGTDGDNAYGPDPLR